MCRKKTKAKYKPSQWQWVWRLKSKTMVWVKNHQPFIWSSGTEEPIPLDKALATALDYIFGPCCLILNRGTELVSNYLYPPPWSFLSELSTMLKYRKNGKCCRLLLFPRGLIGGQDCTSHVWRLFREHLNKWSSEDFDFLTFSAHQSFISSQDQCDC